MKAIFKNMIRAYSGKCDGLVYYYNPRMNRIIVRRMADWKETEQNRVIGSVSSALRALEPSEGYKNDLRSYIERYRKRYPKAERQLYSWLNPYQMLFWAMSKKLGIDLRTLNRDMIYADDLPCITIQRAITAGLLPEVNGADLLVQEI